ncbi:hypothetical protein Tco_1111476 [Tanacetum coccineum]|uniref:Aminotransferase-like plant mobile domain-containing protein n=1 Tax=Tanacetum coccineum TaxID=301880 RepID=A0ABQ5IP76_9ASTR
MANQEQNPPQQEQPFVAAKQVSFNLEDIILNTNNKVALFYPEHTNKEYFKCVFDFISKCCLRKPFTKSPNMYQEYLAEFWYSAKSLENSKISFSIPICGIYGEVGLNTFRNAIGSHYLSHSSEYVAPPSIDVVRKWFPTIGYGEEVSTKGSLRKSLLPPRWRLLMAYIIKCLGGKTGGFDQITNKDAIMMYSLGNGIHIDYANIFWEDIILKMKKKQREKPDQPEEPPFTAHMLAICALDKPVVFKALKTSLRAESVSQGAKPGAKTGHNKLATSSKQPFVSSKEKTKGGSSKAPVGSQTGHSKRRKESSSAMDSDPSRPLVSTPMDTELHKEDQQETGHDILADFTTEADPGLIAPNDFIPPQQDQTKSVSEGLETVLTQPITEKGSSSTAIHGDKEEASTAIHGDKEEASSIIKLEDLAKLVPQIQPSFKDLDSPKDDHVIIIDESDEDEPNTETEDTSVPRSSSPKSSQIQELKNQVLILQSQKHNLELEKNKAEAKVALLKAQPLFPNMGQLNELLDLLFKFNELTKEIKRLKTQVHELEIKLQKELKEIPTKLEDFTKTATSLTSQVAELKTLYLLLNVTKSLNKFVEVLESTSIKARDQSVPSAGQADTMPTEGDKDTNQATIS